MKRIVTGAVLFFGKKQLGTGANCVSLVSACLLALLVRPSPLVAQAGGGCTSPSTGRAAEKYRAAEVDFQKQEIASCAIESAVRLQPDAWQGHYSLALALGAKGDTARAYQEMQSAALLNMAEPQVHLGLGAVLVQMRRPDEAISEFQMVLKMDAASVTARDGIAKALMSERRYAAAIHSLQGAPFNVALQLDLAEAFSKNGELEQAEQVLSTLIALKPSNAQAHLNLGLVDAQRKQYDDAAKEFEQVLRLDPDTIDPGNSAAQVSYLKCLINLLEFSKALPASRQYRRKEPNNFDALELGGEIEQGAGNNAEAEVLLTRAVTMNPAHYNARYFLGLVLASQGKREEARAQLEEALRLDPDSSEARFQLSKVLRALGRGDEAREQMAVLQRKKEKAVHQDIAVSKTNEASQKLHAGESAKAVSLYRESIAEDGSNGRTYYDLSLALRAEKNGHEQRLALDRAVQLDRNFAPTYNQLALLDIEAGETGRAEAELKTAISLDPQFAEAQNNLGVLYGRLGRNEEAERLFRKSMEDDDRYADAALNLGLVLATQGRFSEAERALHQAIELNPANDAARSALAMVLERLKR